MNNFTGEYFNLYPNLFPQPDQAAPLPTDTSVAPPNHYAPTLSHDGDIPVQMAEHNHGPQTVMSAIIQQEAPITTPFEAMNNYRQLHAFTFASNSGAHQPSVASTSGGSSIPFNGSVAIGGLGTWNQFNGGAGGGMALNSFLNPQAVAEHNARGNMIQYPQHPMASGFNQLPLNHPSFFYLPNSIRQQPALNATHYQPFPHPQYPGASFNSYQPNLMAQIANLNALQPQTFGYQQAIGVPAGAYHPEAMGMGQQSFAPYPNNAVDALPEQMQRLTMRSPFAEGELASPAINATVRTLHDASFPSYHTDAAAHQPVYNVHQAIAYQRLPGAPILANQPQINMNEQLTASNHHAKNASQEVMHCSTTESPLTDEPLTPPGHNASSIGIVMVPGEVKEHNRDLVSPTMQAPVPLYRQGIFSPMADSPAAPSPVDPWLNEQAGPANLQENSQLAGKIPAPQPIRYDIPPFEARPAVVNSGTSTPPVQKSLVFEFDTGPQSAGAGPSRTKRHKHRGEGPRPGKGARKTRSPRNSPSPRATEAPAQGSGESFPLFAPFLSNNVIPGLTDAPGQAGSSASYPLNDEMTLYDVFVAMREENDRNRAAGVRNASGDESFTWDEPDIKLFDSLRRPSRR